MASSFHICLSFLLVLFIFSFDNSFAAKTKPQSIIFPIRKDSITNQYYTEIDMGTSKSVIYAVIDLGGKLLWFDCSRGYTSSSYRPISCGSKRCIQAKGSGCINCDFPFRPGCTNNTCGMYLFTPFTNIVSAEGFGEDVTSVTQTDGKVYLASIDVPHFEFSCTSTYQLEGVSNATQGMIGLAMTRTSLHKQLALAFKFPHKFALCIPSSNDNGFGDIFVGGGPYSMPPYGDVSTKLITTPLVINPVSTAPVLTEGEASDEYFIEVKSIKVDEKILNFKTSLLSFDKNGVGGTKLSTIVPYTVLHSSIYEALVKDFVKKASSRKMTRVASVAPFDACFSSKSISSTSTGHPDVPIIDLVLQSENVYWRIYGANSMVKVKNGAYCLGFVDGGSKPRTSIVLGGHQLEDNLIEFDLESSKLGFTSSLLLKNTTCSQSRVF